MSVSYPSPPARPPDTQSGDTICAAVRTPVCHPEYKDLYTETYDFPYPYECPLSSIIPCARETDRGTEETHGTNEEEETDRRRTPKVGETDGDGRETDGDGQTGVNLGDGQGDGQETDRGTDTYQ